MKVEIEDSELQEIRDKARRYEEAQDTLDNLGISRGDPLRYSVCYRIQKLANLNPTRLVVPGSTPTGLDGLMRALQIFRKYGNPSSPTHCEHDVMMVAMPQDGISEADVAELLDLGFRWMSEYDCWGSFRYGSA